MHSNPVARIDWADYNKLAPDAVTALRALGKAVDDSGLDKQLTELLKIRASQLNGCAFCLQFHLNVARKEGVLPIKIDLVATWADTDIFSARERAALAWAEALTKMGQQHIAESVYDELCAHFTPTEVAYLTASIASINAWNRIAGALGFTPPIPTERSEMEDA
ncbi:carboxymuconolactone decarboxylase family protein [Oxalobacteraceae bacterium OM1]|nr:carboxymuconolactone decarboxylase family protein [Oxalobacteraceae bacterium OM1]